MDSSFLADYKKFGLSLDFDVTPYLLADQNGKALATGTFQNYNGESAPLICRLNPDGSLDKTFKFEYPRYINQWYTNLTGIDLKVYPDYFRLAMQRSDSIFIEDYYPDGKHKRSVVYFSWNGYHPYIQLTDDSNTVLVKTYDVLNYRWNRPMRFNMSNGFYDFLLQETDKDTFNLNIYHPGQNGAIYISRSHPLKGTRFQKIVDTTEISSFRNNFDNTVRAKTIHDFKEISDGVLLYGDLSVGSDSSFRRLLIKIRKTGEWDESFKPVLMGSYIRHVLEINGRILVNPPLGERPLSKDAHPNSRIFDVLTSNGYFDSTYYSLDKGYEKPNAVDSSEPYPVLYGLYKIANRAFLTSYNNNFAFRSHVKTNHCANKILVVDSNFIPDSSYKPFYGFNSSAKKTFRYKKNILYFVQGQRIFFKDEFSDILMLIDSNGNVADRFPGLQEKLPKNYAGVIDVQLGEDNTIYLLTRAHLNNSHYHICKLDENRNVDTSIVLNNQWYASEYWPKNYGQIDQFRLVNGKIMITGRFDSIFGEARKNHAWLSMDGKLEPARVARQYENPMLNSGSDFLYVSTGKSIHKIYNNGVVDSSFAALNQLIECYIHSFIEWNNKIVCKGYFQLGTADPVHPIIILNKDLSFHSVPTIQFFENEITQLITPGKNDPFLYFQYRQGTTQGISCINRDFLQVLSIDIPFNSSSSNAEFSSFIYRDHTIFTGNFVYSYLDTEKAIINNHIFRINNFSDPTSIKTKQAGSTISLLIYPNPAASGLVSLPGFYQNSKLQSYSIIDQCGRVIRSANNNYFDCTELKAGFYVISCSFANAEQVNFRFIKSSN